MRIFIGIVEIAGYYSNLAQGLRDLGHDVTFLGANYHPFQYSEEKLNSVPRIHNYIQTKRVITPRSKLLSKIFWVLCEKLSSKLLFLWAMKRHEVFIFGFANSFNIKGRDLIVLKKMGKTIISNIAHGSESRPPYIDGGSVHLDGSISTPHALSTRVQTMREKIGIIQNYSDVVICSPYISHFLTKPFINFFDIGIPWHFDHAKSLPQNEAPRILHAPSRMISKGTVHIREAVERLKSSGYIFDYIELQNKTHAEVVDEIKRCDFIIDQLYSDTPMAGFATEAAWFSKPTIVGGYGWDDLESTFGGRTIPPSHLCHPDEIEAAIRYLLDNRDYCHILGQNAYNYVSTYCDRVSVAKRFLRLIHNDIPSKWYSDPKDFGYLHGWGLPENFVRSNARGLIDAYGVKSLGLSHRPDLEEKFQKFAHEEDSSC